MKKILDLITDEVTKAFTDCGYDAKYGKVTLSNRPDLCEYQCNGAMAGAKAYKKAPFMIADDVVAFLKDSKYHLQHIVGLLVYLLQVFVSFSLLLQNTLFQ